MNLDLSERRILVTGAAQGLGLGIARRLVSAGARVAMADVAPAVAERAAESAMGSRAVAIVKDLADPDAAEVVFQAGRHEFKSFDGLVNCAGWSFHKPVAQVRLQEFDRLVAINQRAPFFLSQKFAAQLTDSDRDPCIINIASVNAVAGNTNLVAYAGTKGALVAMTRAFAVEFAPRIRVAAISPGAVLTHFTEQMIQSGQIDPPAMMERFLIRRFTTVEEIAELVAFLFGPAAGCITGSNWMFDGGYSAQ